MATKNIQEAIIMKWKFESGNEESQDIIYSRTTWFANLHESLIEVLSTYRHGSSVEIITFAESVKHDLFAKLLLSASRYFRVNLTTEEEGDTKSDKWNVQILPDWSLENRFESEIVILRERWTRNWNSQKSRRLPNDNIITPNTYKKSH